MPEKILWTIAAATLICSAQASAQNPMTCLGSAALGRQPQLDARATLEGRTVKVWAFSSRTARNPAAQALEFEKEPIVRKFTATTLTESQGGEQATDEITYEGKNWCRVDSYENRKKCYGIVTQGRGEDGQLQYREIEIKDDGGFCNAYIIAKLEGVQAPAEATPDQRPAGRERRQRAEP